jgi:sigma-B regulation protein RsbU (phosphoserine phosphatase)
LCGHGTGPALLAAETRAYIRALTRISPDVGRVATTVNRLLWEDLTGQRFATLFLARLDRIERTLNYAAAGHCAYLIHESGKFTTLHSQTCPLGLFENTLLRTSEGVPLRSGDILLLVTDGLYEARNEHRAHFGMERCIGLVHAYRENRAEKIAEALLQAARSFVREAPMQDDITIVVARVR